MKSASSIYLHIGLSKTGTTYLQSAVFPHIPSIDYLNKPQSDVLRGNPGPGYGVLERSFNRSTVIWRGFGDTIFSALLGASKEEHRPQRNLLISDEGIGSAGGRKPHLLRLHLKEFSEKAREWGYASVKVICTFRRQDQWIASGYAQRSNRVPKASQKTFDDYVEYVLCQSTGYYVKGVVLDYKLLHEQLALAVGRDNTLMLPYELLAAAPAEYLRRLFDFMDSRTDELLESLNSVLDAPADEEKHNVRSRTANVWAIRKRTLEGAKAIRLRPGRLFKAVGLPNEIPLHFPERGREKTFTLAKDLQDRVLGVYARSNKELAAELDVDLGPYGYY